MKILSVSTATSHLSVALNEDKQVLLEKNDLDSRHHSEHLDSIIQKMLFDQQLKLSDIDRFAVAIGPGSYTGLRIGITTVKMFASILQREVVGISTLKAMASEYTQAGTLVVAMLDARNQNYFAGAYTEQEGKIKNIIADDHFALDKLLAAIKQVAPNYQQVILTGTGLEKEKEKVNAFTLQEEHILHAGLIGKLAVAADPVDPDLLLPHYLRRTPAEMQWHKKTGQPYGPDSDYVEEV